MSVRQILNCFLESWKINSTNLDLTINIAFKIWLGRNKKKIESLSDDLRPRYLDSFLVASLFLDTILVTIMDLKIDAMIDSVLALLSIL